MTSAVHPAWVIWFFTMIALMLAFYGHWVVAGGIVIGTVLGTLSFVVSYHI